MGSLDRVYGAIFCAEQDTLAINKRVIELLPHQDTYPALTRGMFSLRSEGHSENGIYKEWPIHFAASFKDLEDSWDAWLYKFEVLLQNLRWRAARITTEFESSPEGTTEKVYYYNWKALHDEPEPWQFHGGPREFRRELDVCRENLAAAEQRHAADSGDQETLKSLVFLHSRFRKFSEANYYYQKLLHLAPELAKEINPSVLIPWDQKYLTKPGNTAPHGTNATWNFIREWFKKHKD